MIRRTPAKITDSFVNSAHEDHFNVTKAIRDDAPITAQTSVIKSVNFESDRDSAYILRKPLVKKQSLRLGSDFLLPNKEDILSIAQDSETNVNTLTITPKNHSVNSIILRFYDNNLKLHEYVYNGNEIEVPWLEVIKSHDTATHLLLSVNIDHPEFLNNVDSENNAVINEEITSDIMNWNWTLVNATWYIVTQKFCEDYANTIQRFIKIYPHETETSTYVVEIIHPEFNSITSATDTGNPQSLDINLLLDNPYAVRDLYGYGYISCTKILPYILVDDESNLTASNINNSYSVWYLTERNVDSNYNCRSFKLLGSTNPKEFNKKFLILKAFLTTAITTAKYYCCWEVSKDDGVTWEECPEFVSKFSSTITTKLVSDLSSKEFDSIMYEDSLERAANYLVSKKVVRMKLNNNDYSANDLIINRPDVLVLTYPNLSYKYRFQIYLDTEKSTPTPEDKTFTAITSSFTDSTEGYLDNLGSKIKYQTAANGALNIPAVNDGKLILYEASDTVIGDGSAPNPNRYGIGNSITISSVDANYKLKNVTITLANKKLISDTTDYERLGSAVGAIGRSTPTEYWLGGSTNYNPYGMSHIGAEIHSGGVLGVSCNAKNLWVSENSSKTYVAESYGSEENITFVNLTRCLMNLYGGASYLEDVSGSSDITHSRLAIASISVTYTVKSEVQFTSVYLASTTGAFQVSYSDNTKTAEDLSNERNRVFYGNAYYNENQMQLLIYKNNHIYVSGSNSAIIKFLNSITLPEEITKIVPWRGYFLIFSPRNIYLSKYDASSDSYTVKTLSNTVGVSSCDADTIAPILNSVYFKSGNKIYKLVPNLYAASDDILNIHQISTGVNTILEDILNNNDESHNFSYADSDTYSVFIPVVGHTYCITYDFNRQIWSFQDYPIVLSAVKKIFTLENYLYDGNNLYHFRESLNELLSKGREECEDSEVPSLEILTNCVPYADYLSHTPEELVELVVDSSGSSYKEVFNETDNGIKVATAIHFEIDFGQKSSNYTLDKQFLESKLIFATMSSKDTIPITLDIYTDGISRDLHWDSNTDGAIWKTSLDDVGILNTSFGVAGQNYNGIFRQLIVKYSGKGKSIRHIISGYSKSLFKFYSMDVRGRILPKKR